ncbi:MAG TPA: hypothetical protein VG370_20080 [Chloroflexota bacterium]|nr:hypothetical protein [Chloroflexota bacterium]
MVSRLRFLWPGIALFMIIIIVAGTAVMTNTATGAAQPVSAPPETAVYHATAHAQHLLPGGGSLVGAPTAIRGRTMTYGEAHRLRFGGAIDPTTLEWQQRNRLVWVVDLRGTVTVPNASETYQQMVVVLDAQTAQLLGITTYPTGREAATASLPLLARPTGPVPPPIATPEPDLEVTPAPTSTPAPAP